MSKLMWQQAMVCGKSNLAGMREKKNEIQSFSFILDQTGSGDGCVGLSSRPPGKAQRRSYLGVYN